MSSVDRTSPVSKISSYFYIYQEGVINLGLGTRADIGEWKSDVSGHRDVTFKPAREGLKEGKQNACREKFTVQFLSNSRANHFNH